MGDLSENFSRREFACNGEKCCGGSAPVHPDLIMAVQELRDKAGVPLKVSSGFRCKTFNTAINGAENSQHMFGMAADLLIPTGWTPERLAELAETVPLFHAGGIGIYPTWVHVDVRKEKARWRR